MDHGEFGEFGEFGELSPAQQIAVRKVKDLGPYLTPAEVAARLRVSRDRVYRWLLTGKLEGHKQILSDRWLIPAKAVLDQLTTRNAPALSK